VAREHPEVVAQFLKLAEEARADIGDYNRVGENMRFFDPMDKRPEKPVFVNLVRKPKKKKSAAK
jgi:arylsulfatase